MDKNELMRKLFDMKKSDLVDLTVQAVYTLDIVMRHLKTHNLSHIMTDAVIEDMRNNLPPSIHEKLLEEFLTTKKSPK